MFVRTKRFKNNEYAYLVQNKWTKRGTRQKAVKYLGKVILPQIRAQADETTINFTEVKDIEKKSYKETLKIILNCMVNELEFKNQGEISIDISKFKILLDSKPCVLRLKEGFFCDYTLKRLFNLRYVGQEKLEFGYKLAEALLICGISLDKELFVELCNRAFCEHERKNERSIR